VKVASWTKRINKISDGFLNISNSDDLQNSKFMCIIETIIFVRGLSIWFNRKNMDLQKNILNLICFSFLFAFLFFFPGKTFSQEDSGNVYNMEHQKPHLSQQPAIRGENSVEKNKGFINYPNDPGKEPSKIKEPNSSGRNSDLPRETSGSGEVSTLSFNIFLYVLDRFKEE
jgi:hypothetical protein